MQLSALAKNVRLQNVPEYRFLRCEATCSALAERQRYWTTSSSTMFAAAQYGNFGKIFRQICRTSGKQATTEINVRNASERLASNFKN